MTTAWANPSELLMQVADQGRGPPPQRVPAAADADHRAGDARDRDHRLRGRAAVRQGLAHRHRRAPAAGPPLTPGHLLGTDQYGRDVLARILYGGRIDLAIAFGATSVTLVGGTIIGLVAGYLGGKVDSLLMRIVDLFFAFPFLVLIIAIMAMLGPSIFNMFVAIWITSWVSYARIMRAQTVIAKKQQYVLAAQALGYGRLRVMFRHILPNTVSSVIIFSMVDAVGNIILAASLGFLGLGAQPPSPEWGTMISDAQNYVLTSWWLATMPGLAVVFVGVAFSLIGDGLADLLRPGER